MLNSSASTNVVPVNAEYGPQVLDTRLGIEQVGGDSKNYRELLTDFVEQMPAKIQRIHEFCEAHEVEEISRAAHNLKGVAAYLGAVQLSNLAHSLDKQSSGSYTDDLRETIKDLENAANIFFDYANDFLSKNEH